MRWNSLVTFCLPVRIGKWAPTHLHWGNRWCRLLYIFQLFQWMVAFQLPLKHNLSQYWKINFQKLFWGKNTFYTQNRWMLVLATANSHNHLQQNQPDLQFLWSSSSSIQQDCAKENPRVEEKCKGEGDWTELGTVNQDFISKSGRKVAAFWQQLQQHDGSVLSRWEREQVEWEWQTGKEPCATGRSMKKVERVRPASSL